MLNLNKYTPLFMKMFLPILMRASYTRIHIDRNLYMWVFLKLRGQKSTLFGTSTKSSTFLRQTLLIKCRQPQNTSSKIYLSMYTFVKEYLQPFWGLFTVFSKASQRDRFRGKFTEVRSWTQRKDPGKNECGVVRSRCYYLMKWRIHRGVKKHSSNYMYFLSPQNVIF